MPAPRTEASFERAFARACERANLATLKLTLRGQAGWPDRLVLVPGGRPVFVELKRRGERLRALQERRAHDLRMLGYAVITLVDEDSLSHSLELVRRIHAECSR